MAASQVFDAASLRSEKRKRVWRSAAVPAAALGSLAFLVHVLVNLRAQHIGYGLFRDELYYIVCGRNLDWGYVDQPPLVALAARFSELVFGRHSLALFRLLPSLASALEVAGTGLLVLEMGGGRLAQLLAMVSVLACPLILGIDALLTMNAFEPLFWIGTAYAVLRALRGDRRWWAAAGVIAGLGLQNKWNEVFFLFAMLAALLVCQPRKLRNRWFVACIALILLVIAPNLLWQAHRGWPTLVLLKAVAASGKNFKLGPAAFLETQASLIGPLASALLLSGLVWLLRERRARPLRWVGVLYLVYVAAMMALHAIDYYLAPVYPLMFALGALAWEQWLRPGKVKRIFVPVFYGLSAVNALLGLFAGQPLLTPPEYARRVAGSAARPRDFAVMAKSPLPTLMADMTGWRAIADELAGAYWALAPQDRAKAVIFTENYGEASAVNVYRPDVPVAISGHQNYWYWGPRGHDGSVTIVFGGSRKKHESDFASVVEIARNTNPWGQPYESAPIYLCRHPRLPLSELWPSLKVWL